MWRARKETFLAKGTARAQVLGRDKLRLLEGVLAQKGARGSNRGEGESLGKGFRLALAAAKSSSSLGVPTREGTQQEILSPPIPSHTWLSDTTLYLTLKRLSFPASQSHGSWRKKQQRKPLLLLN